jgi:hypothetical protein
MNVAPTKAAEAPKNPRIPRWLITTWTIGIVVAVCALIIPRLFYYHFEAQSRAIGTELSKLPTAKQERTKELERQIRQGKTQLTITGPSSLQAGASNRYSLAAATLDGEGVAAKITVRVTDKAGKELAREEQQTADGKLVFTIPLSASVRPDEQLTLEATADRLSADGKPITLKETLPLERPSYLTYLSTDKPLYRPGEVVAFRSLTLERSRLQPTDEDLQLLFTITDPSGQVVFRKAGSDVVRDPNDSSRLLYGPDGRAVRGIGFGEFAVSPNAAGGEYVLAVNEIHGRFPTESRKFIVNRYQAPRLHKELEFTRRSFGPGDEVLAACRVSRIEGGKPLADASVTATIIVDGKRLDADGVEKADAALALKTDADGAVAVRFKLPKNIDVGDASLSIAFTDGGNSETISRPIPIVVRRLRVDFYPEGGDLVAGVSNRVYFAARTPLGKPAEMRGRIFDRNGKVVAEPQTFADEKTPEANQGMGAFTFTPEAGQSYELQIVTPAGIPYKVELPKVKADGVVLSIESHSLNSAEPIKATVRSAGGKRRLLVAAYCRGRFVGSDTADVAEGESKILSIMPSGGMGGVHRVTVFEDRSTPSVSRLVPVAERLIFRRPSNYLNVSIQPDRSQYVPGDNVRLAVNAKDESGKLTGSIALVQVVDRAALSLADDKTLHSMPTHLLLAGEVRRPEDLENADFLLSDNPSAVTAVDLLLGTQGWRRFSEQDPEKFRADHEKEADRRLASTGQTPLRVTNRKDVEEAIRPALSEASVRAESEYMSKWTKLRGEYDRISWDEHEWSELTESGAVLAFCATVLFVILVPIMVFCSRAISKSIATLPKQEVSAFVGATILGAIMLAFFIVIFMMSVTEHKSATFQSVGNAVGGPTKSIASDGVREDRSLMKEIHSPPLPGQGVGDKKRAGSVETPAPGDRGPRAENEPAIPHQGNVARASLKQVPGEQAERSDEPVSGPTDPNYYSGVEKAPPGESARRRYQRVHNEQTAGPSNTPRSTAERSFRELDRANRTLADPNGAGPFVIREYAHENVPGRSTRSDFTETVYWHPVLILPGGETFVKFNVSDAITSYQALAIVHTPDGRLGSAHLDFAAKLPFSIDGKLPLEVTASDEIRVPVAVSNDTDLRRQVKLSVDASGLTRLDGEAEAKLDIDAQKRGRAVFRYKPSLQSGEARVRLDGRSDIFTDRVERTIQIVPDGFPVVGAFSGTLKEPLRANVVLPADVTPGSFKVRAEAYPSIIADLLTGIDGMLQEPHGCFEQTSSSSYPNLMILDYLNRTGQSQPQITRRALELLELGYNRLVGFECISNDGKRQGFDWFGGTEPHEALTAYGLMQFHDLARVYDKVDRAMIERTRYFLLSRRDGTGNFRHLNQSHSFGAVSQPVFNAYLTWALTEAESDADLTKETKLLVQQSEQNSDPYFLALVANSLLKRSEKAEGGKILDKLAALQRPDGSLLGHESIVGSYGRDLETEATSLAVLAWLKAEQTIKYRNQIQKAAAWLTARRGYRGCFGSTQATILSLKALAQLAHDSKRLMAGSFILSINGERIMQKEFAGDVASTQVLELSERDLAKLKAGANEVRLEVTGGNELPAKIDWSYRTIQPPSAADCPIKLTTTLDKSKVNEGDMVRLTAVIENAGKKSCSMTTAIIGLPAGLAAPEDLKQLQQLTRTSIPLDGKERQREAAVSFVEVRGREIILYWRGLEAGQRVEVPIDLIARTPGIYRGPASRAYLYYGAESKCWTAPLSIAINER